MIGQVVSHYRITGILGSGGMGVVYRAQDLALQRTVALKFLPEDMFQDPGARARFQREARAASGLSHPNICVIHELGESDHRPFIAMECLEGQTIAERLGEGRLAVDSVIDLGIQIAGALGAAHDLGIVHRDIKPANIFLTTRGDAKVLDFGLAMTNRSPAADPDLRTQGHDDLTRPGTALGTASYMSPEQALGKPLDSRTDLFSLGVVLYEMVAGVRPFQGETSAGVWNQLLNATPVAPDRLNPDVPPGLATIIRRCLAKNPDDRHSSAHELAADLERVRRDRAAAVTLPAAAGSAVEDDATVRRSRWRPAAWAAVALVVLAASVGLYVSLRGGPGGDAAPRGVAVLPFENLSPDEADAFFAAGVHEDVRTRLAGIRDLTVISRTSVGQFRSGGDLKDIARRLRARYIVEGSVRRNRNQVRITAQLVDATTDRSLWSESYDRELTDVFAVQSEIAARIAGALRARITPQERTRLASSPTSNAGAYDEYLRARAILHSSGITSDRRMEALERLERATAADPRFAEAWALLSEAWSDRVVQLRQLDDRQADLAQAAAAAESALTRAKELDPGGPASLRAQGYFEQTVRRDPVRALRSLDRALAVYPNDASTLLHQAALFLELGQADSAVANLERAYSLDSENGMIAFALTFAYELTGRYAEMVPFLERLLELEPEKTHYGVQAKYYAFLATGSLAAFREFEQAVRSVPRTEKCDVRSVQNNEMAVAMVNGEFDSYRKAWLGKWDRHYAGHGDWACPAIINDEANHAHLLLEHGEVEQARKVLQRAKESTARPFTEQSLCIFDRAAYQPKLDVMNGDSLAARRNLEAALPAILRNDAFPRGIVERSVLLESADMVAPDRVFAIYRNVVEAPASLVRLETVCANPWIYPNLLRDPDFIREVRADGRFVEFLEHFHRLAGRQG